MQFRRFFEDVDPRHINDIAPHISKKEPPLEQIFKGRNRFAQELNGGFKYTTPIKELVGKEYDLDFPSWVGYKTKDQIKKNPIRIGRILAIKLKEFQKEFKQTDISETYTRQQLADQIKKLNELLQTTNLFAQWKNSQETEFVIIFTRSPIDVLRMGDFDEISSCHSPDGDYFHCAQADSTQRGAIAYLVKKSDYDSISDKMEDSEIFKDSDRNIKGIQPLARIRIRQIMDSNDNELGVPSLKIYSKNYKYVKDFIDQVKEVCLQQDISNFDFREIKLMGGTYEDCGYDVRSTVKQLWGKTITVFKKDNVENNFKSDEFDSDDEREHRIDAFMDEIDGLVLRDVCGFHRDLDDYMSISIARDDDTIDLTWNISGEFLHHIYNGKRKLKKSSVNISDFSFVDDTQEEGEYSIVITTNKMDTMIDPWLNNYANPEIEFERQLKQETHRLLRTVFGEPYDNETFNDIKESSIWWCSVILERLNSIFNDQPYDGKKVIDPSDVYTIDSFKPNTPVIKMPVKVMYKVSLSGSRYRYYVYTLPDDDYKKLHDEMMKVEDKFMEALNAEYKTKEFANFNYKLIPFDYTWKLSLANNLSDYKPYTLQPQNDKYEHVFPSSIPIVYPLDMPNRTEDLACMFISVDEAHLINCLRDNPERIKPYIFLLQDINDGNFSANVEDGKVSISIKEANSFLEWFNRKNN